MNCHLLLRRLVTLLLVLLAGLAQGRPPPSTEAALATAVVVEPKFYWDIGGTGFQGPETVFAELGAAVNAYIAYAQSKALCGVSFTVTNGSAGVNNQQTSTLVATYGDPTNDRGTIICLGGTFQSAPFVVPIIWVCPEGYIRYAWQEGALRVVCGKQIPPSANCPGSCAPNSTPVFAFGNPVLAATRVKVHTDAIVPAVVPLGLGLGHTYRSDLDSWTLEYGVAGVLLGPNDPVTKCVAGVAVLPNRRDHACFPLTQLWQDSALYKGSSGQIVRFWSDGSGGLTAPGFINERVSRSQAMSGMRVATPDNWIEQFDVSGNLIERRHASGSVRLLTYSSASTPPSLAPVPGLLVGVADAYGRNLTLSYDAQSHLKSVADPAGLVYQLVTDATGSILEIINPDLTSRRYIYDEPAKTSGSQTRNRLTGLVDEAGARLATYHYAVDGRALSTERAGGVDLYSFDDQSRVTTPLGEVIGFSWRYVAGTNRLVTASVSRSCPSCAQTLVRGIEYDSNGNVAINNDFDGSRTCFTHELARNVELVRVEGLPAGSWCPSLVPPSSPLPAGSRKVSTQWHPDWRLQTRRAEPGRITTTVYNGQPDPFAGNSVASCAAASALLPDGKPIAVVCKQVEQATTDANGSQGFAAALQATVANRVQTWTYNRFGQVLTHDGPRTDVSDVTTYGYYSDSTADHTLGDLASVTNAVGKLTQYTKYNKHGQVLESVDSNGVVTTNTYDLRQRLTSSGVGGQTTRYEYWPNGLLKKVTAPSASFVSYEYDAAQRLTATADNLGNRIEYTLDNAGNRTSEKVKDPGGTLRRQITRRIDALGRVQQITGRE